MGKLFFDVGGHEGHSTLAALDPVFAFDRSELGVLGSILDAGQEAKLDNVLIDLDALKIPSQRDRVAALMKRVIEARISYFTPEQVQYGMVTN